MAREGPTILWEELKGKNVKTNDGKDLGAIKEVAENYIRLEKGFLNRDKYWIPKYVADAYDGKVLWLLVSSDDIAKGYSYTTHPEKEQYARGFETFRTTQYGQRATYLPDFDQKIRMTEKMAGRNEDYRNIRDPE
ncbi:MAG: hypothetical protein AB1351_03385 [Thermoproteota archaeon]